MDCAAAAPDRAARAAPKTERLGGLAIGLAGCAVARPGMTALGAMAGARPVTTELAPTARRPLLAREPLLGRTEKTEYIAR